MKNIYFCSRTSHEVRGLKLQRCYLLTGYGSRTSHEVRGLKSTCQRFLLRRSRSHLTRGAWIEIHHRWWPCISGQCRTSHEVRGLKLMRPLQNHLYLCRTSHEVRGLKFAKARRICSTSASHLTRGAWIEIGILARRSSCFFLSHLTRGAWIEIAFILHFFLYPISRTSHEVRGLK